MAKAEKSVPQIEKFREAARELETDESEAAFDRALKKVVKAPPPKDKPKAATK
ncbi:DNA-binding protein [Mesorhizobium caraganae]|uniref:DNA-binding protein n=1 Tax=Mesorhizobium caraganae TaxID=483206 RepID=UPI001FE90336|nr:DNA-binding protein [Mesorhizobium caraganae]